MARLHSPRLGQPGHETVRGPSQCARGNRHHGKACCGKFRHCSRHMHGTCNQPDPLNPNSFENASSVCGVLTGIPGLVFDKACRETEILTQRIGHDCGFGGPSSTAPPDTKIGTLLRRAKRAPSARRASVTARISAPDGWALLVRRPPPRITMACGMPAETEDALQRVTKARAESAGRNRRQTAPRLGHRDTARIQ
jgi:hypothetical protein